MGSGQAAARIEHDTEPSPDRWVGRVLAGRYDVVAPLGAGGMGVVYRAVQRSVQRPVAVKILCADVSDSDERFVHRFRNEALLASRLAHPNTVTVFDFGVEGCGSLFIAMELVHGESLGALLRASRGLEWHRAARIAAQIADSLHEAHEVGIVHRDLKPENVMLTQVAGRPDHVKVLDFGIATILAPDVAIQRVTRPNEVFGTPQYMAPEQATGEVCTHHTDIYSLGVMLFEMLSGTRPFEGATPMATLLAHAHDPLPPLRGACGDVPLRLETIVLKMLARTPAQRPATMLDVSRALRRVLRDSGTGFAPASRHPSGASARAAASKSSLPRVSSPRLESVTPPPRQATRRARADARVVGTARCDVATSLAAIESVIGDVAEAVRSIARLTVEDARRPKTLFDPTLAADVLAIVNVALTDRTRRPIDAMDRAVVMVGFESVRHAALLATVLRLFHALDKQGASGRDVRTHIAVVAGAAMAIAPYPDRIHTALAAVGARLGHALVAAALPVPWQRFCERTAADADRLSESEVFGAPLAILGQRAFDGYEWPTADGDAVRLALKLADAAMVTIPDTWSARLVECCREVGSREEDLQPAAVAERLGAFDSMLEGLCDVARIRPAHRRATRLATVMGTSSSPPARRVAVRPRPVAGDPQVLQSGLRTLDRSLRGRFSERGLALDVLKFVSRALDARLALYLRAQRDGDALTALYGLGKAARKVQPRFKIPLVAGAVWPPMASDWFNDALAGRQRVASAVRRVPEVAARLPGCFELCDDASWTAILFRGVRPGLVYVGWADERTPDAATTSALELVARRLEHAFDPR